MKTIIVYVLLMHEGASYQLGEVLPKMKEKKKSLIGKEFEWGDDNVHDKIHESVQQLIILLD